MVIPSKKLQKYLIPRPNGKLGTILKRDAPDDIKKEYRSYKKLLKDIHRIE